MLIAGTALNTVYHNTVLPDALRMSLLIISYHTIVGYYLLPKCYVLGYTVNCSFQRIAGKKNNFDLH